MDFTELYKHSGSLVSFSPGAHFVLNAVHDRVIIRKTDSFQISRTWVIDPTPSESATLLNKQASKAIRSSTDSRNNSISHAAWSSDSEYVLAASVRGGFVQVFKLRDEGWTARIDCGVEGLVKAVWAPDARTILCFSDWGLRVTIWSLVTGTASYIQFPIFLDKGFDFHPDGRYFVLAERHKSKDMLGLYDASESYKLVRRFPSQTSSLASLALSPTGNHIAVWEGPLEYKVHIMTLAGNLLASFSPDPEPVLGIREVAWHPSGMFLAVAGWDDKVHIIDSLSWSPVTTFELSSRISSEVAIWREPSKWLEATEGRGFLSYEKLRGPQTITLNKTDHTKANPKSGAIQLEWNQTGSLLLVRYETTPTAAHLYLFPSPNEAFVPRLRSVLLHSKTILQAHWNPVRKGSLALCCGNRSVYTWSDEWEGESGEQEEMAECIGVPAKEFDTRNMSWSRDGKGLILLDKETFCCAFEVEEVTS
ncbi:WD repeat-containing protein 8 [Lentinula aff. lateritia]|uniref:WD repeat-containing protein 8 n=1 Tax=Lentinula aff. lateritia TaxID=2804960 RepID=A0ACC1UGU3_9AGAR|nr:WD repeat-containing protein 8 [Lentinula aff. lateritia]